MIYRLFKYVFKYGFLYKTELLFIYLVNEKGTAANKCLAWNSTVEVGLWKLLTGSVLYVF